MNIYILKFYVKIYPLPISLILLFSFMEKTEKTFDSGDKKTESPKKEKGQKEHNKTPSEYQPKKDSTDTRPRSPSHSKSKESNENLTPKKTPSKENSKTNKKEAQSRLRSRSRSRSKSKSKNPAEKSLGKNMQTTKEEEKKETQKNKEPRTGYLYKYFSSEMVFYLNRQIENTILNQ